MQPCRNSYNLKKLKDAALAWPFNVCFRGACLEEASLGPMERERAVLSPVGPLKRGYWSGQNYD